MAALRKTRIGLLIEFSRAVHAEMDAILSAARAGVSPVGTRLFVTTFPCHYCARHIVTAGVHEVQYIEPYAKSLAIDLHEDAIETEPDKWKAPQPDGTGKVLFRAFVGVAPRLYPRAFLKDRNYKDKMTGKFQMGTADWGNPWSLSKVSYPDLEAQLTK
jgi:hypothetical protein